MKSVFWFLASIDAAALAVVVVFFVWGLADRTVSADNAMLWLAILAAPAVIIWVGFRLRSDGRVALASGALSLLAIPTLLAALLFGSIVLFQGNFQ